MSILNSLSHTLLSAQLRIFHSGPLPSLSSARGGGGGWDSDSDPSGPEVVGRDSATGPFGPEVVGRDSATGPFGPEVVGRDSATAGSSGESGFGGNGTAGGGGGGSRGGEYLDYTPPPVELKNPLGKSDTPLQIDPYYLPEGDPITKPAVPAVKPDSTWLESMGIGQGVASAIWWALATLLVLAFIIAVVVWVVRRRDGRGQDSHGPAIVVYAAVGMGALWSLILWGFSRT